MWPTAPSSKRGHGVLLDERRRAGSRPHIARRELCRKCLVPAAYSGRADCWPGKAWKDIADWNAEGHIASVKDVSRHALQTLANSQADIIYLHIPAPHPPEFWDRRTGNLLPEGRTSIRWIIPIGFWGKCLRAPGRTALGGYNFDRAGRSLLAHKNVAASAGMERGGRAHLQWWQMGPASRPAHPHGGEQSAETVTASTSLMFVHDFVATQIQRMAQ